MNSLIIVLFSFIFIVYISIIFHEVGHMYAAKHFGVSVKEFALGFGPKLFSKITKSGTIVSVRLFPIGGFCALTDTELEQKTRWQRAIIDAAGCMNNVILSFLGIIPFMVFQNLSFANAFKRIIEFYKVSFSILPAAFVDTITNTTGPIGLVESLNSMAKGSSFIGIIFLMLIIGTILNVILVIFNLLPFPSLDGGHMLLLFIDWIFEKISGKKIPKKLCSAINTGGSFVLLTFSIWILFADLW